MKPLIVLLIASLISIPAFSQSDLVKVPLVKLSAITAGNSRKAGTTEAPSPDAARQTVSHGFSVSIRVDNLGTTAENVVVKWFAMGRYETSKNFFRNGDGEKNIKVAPKSSSEEIVADCYIESHDTKSKKGTYQSGGKLVGWVVAMYDTNGKIQAVVASDAALKRFAEEPPNRQRKGKGAPSE
jgi:hypothetical protein